MNPVLKKLQFKAQSPVLLLDAPPELEGIAQDFGVELHRTAKTKYDFALSFVRSLAGAKAAAKQMKKSLAAGAIFWLAYPKGTSKKYPAADVNRDSAHAALKELGFDGVSLVALDDDWSAMRFKRVDH